MSSALVGLRATPCRACYSGIISAGSPGEGEEALLTRTLPHGAPPGALAFNVPDKTKQDRVPGIVTFYEQRDGVRIPSENVYFFDDRADNVEHFTGRGYNAHQISCASRDPANGNGVIGLCGAVPSEINFNPGVGVCQ